MGAALLLQYLAAAAIVGVAYALAWFCGRWVGVALSLGSLLGILLLWLLTQQALEAAWPATVPEADGYKLVAIGLVFVVAGASGPALFGHHKAASVTSLIAGMFVVPASTIVALAIGFSFGPSL